MVDKPGSDGADPRSMTNQMEPGQDARFSIRRHTLRMGACGLRRETSYRWWIRPGSRRKRDLR